MPVVDMLGPALSRDAVFIAEEGHHALFADMWVIFGARGTDGHAEELC